MKAKQTKEVLSEEEKATKKVLIELNKVTEKLLKGKRFNQETNIVYLVYEKVAKLIFSLEPAILAIELNTVRKAETSFKPNVTNQVNGILLTKDELIKPKEKLL